MEERALRKTRVGIVVSDKMDKSIVVAIKDNVKPPPTARSSSVPPSFTLTTKTTNAASATP